MSSPTAQGAALPGATVTIHNQATGVDTILITNAAGAYTSPPLVLGQYSVTVDMQGFKKAVTGGILLQGGEAVRNDVAMQVGGVQETVQVEGRTGIDVTTPDVAHTVNEAYYRALPIVTAADVRLAEAVLQIQPGFLPMRPNGDPMFRGSQFNSRINGGQTMATENFFDGAAFGYAVGHQQSHESTPPVEAVQEVKVISTSYSAQYGHTSGGFIEYTGKSGTNSYRGSLYDYVADDKFNSTGFFAKKAGTGPSPLSNNNYGATFGGPVKLFKYDGHNKTFFFVNYDYTRLRSGVLPGFGNTTPIDAFKNGDFSALLTGNQIAVDALGRPVLGGQIFNPATTRLVNGIPVRDPYPGNVIPANDPMRSLVASRIVPLMVHPDRPGISNNVAGNPAGDQTWELNARNIMTRVDHNFSKSFRGSTSFYWNHRPSVRNCGEVAGCAVPNNPETDPSKNTDYYGNGFFQRISTATPASAVRLDRPRQPPQPLHSGLRPVVHGREQPGGWRPVATASLGRHVRTNRRHSRHDRRTSTSELRRQHSLQPAGAVWLARVRIPGEQPLAVLGRPDMGQGPPHPQERIRVPQPRLSVPRVGRRIGGGRVPLQSSRHGRIRRQRQQPGANRRSVRIIPARAGADRESDDSR